MLLLFSLITDLLSSPLPSLLVLCEKQRTQAIRAGAGGSCYYGRTLRFALPAMPGFTSSSSSASSSSSSTHKSSLSPSSPSLPVFDRFEHRYSACKVLFRVWVRACLLVSMFSSPLFCFCSISLPSFSLIPLLPTFLLTPCSLNVFSLSPLSFLCSLSRTSTN